MAFNRTIFPQINRDSLTGEIIKERIQITTKVNNNGLILLDQYPDTYSGVTLSDSSNNYLVEVKNINDILNSTYYCVNYKGAEITVHQSYIGQVMNVSYMGIGSCRFSSSLVATKVDENENVTETLADIIANGQLAIDMSSSLGSASQAIDALNTKIDMANGLTINSITNTQITAWFNS